MATVIRTLLVYGEFTDPNGNNFFVIRFPEKRAKGQTFRKLMAAVVPHVKEIAGTPTHKKAPYWNIDSPGNPVKNEAGEVVRDANGEIQYDESWAWTSKAGVRRFEWDGTKFVGKGLTTDPSLGTVEL